jgi:hypothetical protein
VNNIGKKGGDHMDRRLSPCPDEFANFFKKYLVFSREFSNQGQPDRRFTGDEGLQLAPLVPDAWPDALM